MPTVADIEERVLQSSALPSLPHVAVRIIELSRDPEVTVHGLADCLSADPALVQKILRTVNSPFYGLRDKVSTISRAVTYLGVNALRGLMLGFSLARETGGDSAGGFSMITFWRYAMTHAVAAKVLAARAGYADPEEAFVAGMIEDLGVLALSRAVPQEYAVVLARRREALRQDQASAPAPGPQALPGSLLCRIEREVLGTDHARIGGRLCSKWGLPDILAIPVTFHHAPEDLAGQEPQVVDLTRLLHLAALVGRMFNTAKSDDALHEIERLALAYFRLEPAGLGAILQQIAASVEGVAELFEVEIGKPLGYDEILQAANQELARLTLAAERSAQEEARTKAEMERRTRQLESLNTELANRANRDAFSGTFNRGFFDRFLGETFERGRAAGEPMGLILIDVHHFKHINDTYGHPQGDAVIIELAKRLRGATRDSDVVARFGGDEFAVVLPASDLAAVRVVATRLRAAVWDRPSLALDGRTLDVAIGLGTVWVSDYARAQNPAYVLQAADRLLYASKRTRDRMIRLVRI